MNEAKIIPIRIEGRELHSYFWRGKLTWIAGEVGRFLGYAKNGTKLNEAIRDNWRSELAEGVDYDIIEGSELADFREFMGDTPAAGVSFTARLLILYEPGLNKVCLLTTMPLGKQLRRFVAEEVMPRLARGEAILPPGGSMLATVADAPPWVASIFDVLARASADNAATLAALGAGVGQVAGKVDQLARKVDQHEEKLSKIERAVESQRVDLKDSVKRMHRKTILECGGLCPCCSRVRLVETLNGNLLNNGQYDHFFSASRAKATETWLICKVCHDGITYHPRGQVIARQEVEPLFAAYQVRLSQTKSPQLSLLDPSGAEPRQHGR